MISLFDPSSWKKELSGIKAMPHAIRSYQKRYLIALFTIAFMITLSQLVIQTFLGWQKMDSHMINLSGRQRMLSQLISKKLMQDALAPNPQIHREVRNHIKVWQQMHRDIFYKDHLWNQAFTNDPDLNRLKGKIIPAFERLQNHYQEQHQNRKENWTQILLADQVYLKLMDATVDAMQAYAERKLRKIRFLEFGLFSLTLMILILEGVFIFRPLMAFLRKSMINMAVRRDFSNHRQRMRLMGQMTSQIIHEVSNPLQSCRINLELLGDDLEELEGYGNSFRNSIPLPSMKEKFQDILKGIEIVESLTTSLRDFGKASAKPQSSINLFELCHTALRFVSLAGQNKVPISIQCPRDLVTYGNEVELLQILTNIMHNALDATSHRAKPNVMVKASKEKDHVLLRIHDNGPGFPNHATERAFDPFYTTKHGSDRMGLGLYIVKEIATKNHIDITINSRPNGSTVSLRFPFLP